MADIIFSVGSIIFILALIPSVRAADKPALATSIMTGSVLAVYAVTFTTLDLNYAALTTGMTAALWFTLAIQKVVGE